MNIASWKPIEESFNDDNDQLCQMLRINEVR